MKKIALAGTIILVTLAGWLFYHKAEAWRLAALYKSDPCRIPIKLTDEAEKQPGGALYDGPIPKTKKEMESFKELEGSHHIHASLYGGELFMAKDQIHHIETVFTEDCGLRIIIYNAFTKPIRVDRFQAVALLIPANVNRPFIGMVFLKPSPDGSVLQTRIEHDLDDLLGAELHVKYPESGEPEMFDVYLGDLSEIGIKE